MRFIQIAFFLILLSCSNSSTGDNGAQESGTEAQSTNNTNTKGVDIPVMGGPAELVFNVSGINDAKSYLISSVAGANFRVDSSIISKGLLKFGNKDGYPQGLYYASLPNEQYVQMFLSEDQKFEMTFDANDILNTMQIKGSKENEVFYNNLKFEADYNPKYQNLIAKMSALANKNSDEYKSLDKEKVLLEKSRMDHLQEIYRNNEDLLFVKFKKAGQNPTIRADLRDEDKVYYYRKEFWDNVDFSDSRLIRTPVVSNKLNRYMKELTPQNSDSIVKYAKYLIDKTLPYPEYYKFIANWVAIQYDPAKTTLMDPEKVYVNLVQEYFTRERAFWSDSMEVYALQQRAGEMAQSLIGLKGPDVISTDQFGKTKSIYEKSADYIIVYMYNPTCEHCMKETPLLVEWYNKNKNKGADVYAIAIDTEEKEWKDYITKNSMGFTNVFDPTNESIYAKYYVNVTPELYVLNKDRIIIGKNLKVFQIDTIIERDKNGE